LVGKASGSFCAARRSSAARIEGGAGGRHEEEIVMQQIKRHQSTILIAASINLHQLIAKAIEVASKRNHQPRNIS
jgi:hypothetical protein